MDAAQIALPFAAAVGASALLTPGVMRLAWRFGVVDRPSERGVSRRANLPLLGGLAVAAGFGVGLVAAALLVSGFEATRRLSGVLLGALVVLALGVWDDKRGLGATAKFAGQLVAALLAVGGGLRIGYLTEPTTLSSFMLPAWFGWVVSVLWIVGITNALNLIDGLDGLATGVGAIICATLTAIAWQGGHVVAVGLGVALLGGLLGFLPWNFPPARIFLGDTGALFVGFTLSALALEGYRQLSLVPFVVPLLALAVPILDTLLSIVRRLRQRTSVFSADRAHMHHRLLEVRGSTRAAVLQFYLVTACFGLIALSFTQLQGIVALICLLAVVGLTLRLLWNLGALPLRRDAAAGRSTAAPGEEER